MTDQEIIQLYRTKGKQEQAFGILVKEYQEKMYWHIRRMVVSHADADDVVQNTLVKVWKALPKFRADSGLYTWIYRIATNEAISFLNQRKKRSAQHIDDPEMLALSRLTSDELFDGDALQAKLYAVIETLPSKQKLVFQMKYLEELKYQEISEILDTSVGALKASYHHAVKKIEEAFKED